MSSPTLKESLNIWDPLVYRDKRENKQAVFYYIAHEVLKKDLGFKLSANGLPELLVSLISRIRINGVKQVIWKSSYIGITYAGVEFNIWKMDCHDTELSINYWVAGFCFISAYSTSHCKHLSFP